MVPSGFIQTLPLRARYTSQISLYTETDYPMLWNQHRSTAPLSAMFILYVSLYTWTYYPRCLSCFRSMVPLRETYFLSRVSTRSIVFRRHTIGSARDSNEACHWEQPYIPHVSLWISLFTDVIPSDLELIWSDGTAESHVCFFTYSYGSHYH